MSVLVSDLVAYCDEHLNASAISDYCPNGLQVDATPRVSVMVSAVTACERAIDCAIEYGADVLLVHHGYFWKGESAALTGMKGRRIAKLFRHNISLLAYHLPLDVHPVLGNNAQLARLLDWDGFAASDNGLIWMTHFDDPVAASSISDLVAHRLGRMPLHIAAGNDEVSCVAWCTGAAQSMLQEVERFGADMFISGEISEPTVHAAREMGIHYLAAGHHATERYGVKALGEHLSEHFGLTHYFVDIDNPV
jgi:dinuclear metal center YbgI/SA1388 family protein